jgi:methylthioribose-1-phosphate isomerase
VLPHHAEQILDDLAWPALATALTRAETAGHAPRQLLELAARQRSLDDARSTAKTLTWRIQRLGTRPAPSQRARAAQARSATTARATRSAEPHVPGTSHQPSATASHPRHR